MRAPAIRGLIALGSEEVRRPRSFCTERVRRWPDGTPKKFQDPKDEWKNWIDFDAPYAELTDVLNRQRVFFWEVDTKGRLWRKEIDHPDKRFGEMKDARIVDYFYGHVQRNRTGEYEEEWPWVHT